MSVNQVAINEDGINKIILEISDCADEVGRIFNKINDLVSETKDYYDCACASNLRKKYSLFNDNYKIILNNIRSYKTDLSNLKKKYKLGIADLSQQILKDAASIDASSYMYREEN